MDSNAETQHGDTISEAETHQLAVQTQAQLATIAQVYFQCYLQMVL